MNDSYVHTTALMGTVVTFQIIGTADAPASRATCAEAVQRAVEWFQSVEECCSRFDPDSEVQRLGQKVGRAVPVSDMLFGAVTFAVALAEDSDGAFDPTVGGRMEALGFNRHYRTGAIVESRAETAVPCSYRDVRLDPEAKTITLAHPLVLDLGAVAKGLAVDLAALELKPFGSFSIDAGGDLYLGGTNAAGAPWSVGIRHPRDAGQVMELVEASNEAVCTSGDYERRSGSGDEHHHIVDPRSDAPPASLTSVTVIAPSAMVADALATTALVLGPTAGFALLRRHGVRGVLITPDLQRIDTHAA